MIQDTNKVYFDVPVPTITVDHTDEPSQYNSSSYLCDLPILPPPISLVPGSLSLTLSVYGSDIVLGQPYGDIQGKLPPHNHLLIF